MTVDDVEKLLGRADGASVFDSGDEWTLTLHYPGFDLFFDQSDAFRLSVIEAGEECSCHLFGDPLFPKTRREIIDLLRENLPEAQLGRLEEHRDEDLEETTLNVPSLWTTFYFNLEEELQSVNWSVFIGPDDEIVWPGVPS